MSLAKLSTTVLSQTNNLIGRDYCHYYSFTYSRQIYNITENRLAFIIVCFCTKLTEVDSI